MAPWYDIVNNIGDKMVWKLH